MNWRESIEELAAESFGLIFSHTYTNTYTVCVNINSKDAFRSSDAL